MTMIGFDYASVDANQPPDFVAAKSAGARFGIVRSVYGRAVKGQTYPGPFRDPVWKRDHQAVRDAGLTLGTYLFLCAPKSGVSTPSPEEQVDVMLDYAREIRVGDFPPFIDVEEDSTLSSDDYFEWVERACRRARERLGTWPGLYTSKRVWDEHLNNHAAGVLKSCALWIAKPWPWAVRTPVHLDGAPTYDPYLIPPFGSQWFWYQYQGDATQWPGFSSTVDANRFNVLAKGASSDAVRWIQEHLNVFFMGAANARPPLATDGIFGAKTEDALKAFQVARSLVADGVYGAKSHAQLAWVSDV